MSSDTQIIPEDKRPMTDDEILAYSQGMRKRLVDDLTQSGSKMPTDKAEATLMLMALSDMDKVAISNKKIGSEQAQSEADRVAAMVIARINNQFNANPFKANSGMTIEVEADLSMLPEIEMVPGHTDVGLEDRNYNSFMKDMGVADEGE